MYSSICCSWNCKLCIASPHTYNQTILRKRYNFSCESQNYNMMQSFWWMDIVRLVIRCDICIWGFFFKFKMGSKWASGKGSIFSKILDLYKHLNLNCRRAIFPNQHPNLSISHPPQSATAAKTRTGLWWAPSRWWPSLPVASSVIADALISWYLSLAAISNSSEANDWQSSFEFLQYDLILLDS